MFQSLGKHKDLGLLFLRLGWGFTFIYVHGWPKLAGGQEKWTAIGGAMASLGITFLPVVWGFLCAAVEFGGGLLLILGWHFRPACALLTFNMLVATLSMASKGGGQMGTAYPFEILMVFLALLFLGPGKYSLDKN